jgi:aldehyde dehydrogenase (NAD+)
MMTPSGNTDQMYVGGRWVTPVGSERFNVISPWTEERIGSVALADRTDADLAMQTARTAFDDGGWTTLTPAERARYVTAIADGLEARLARSGAALTAEMGKPIAAAERGNQYAVAMARDFAQMGETLRVEEPREVPGGTSRILREPVGVALAIVPWNSPHPLAINKLAPALIAGCTVVAKMAPEAPYNTAVLAEAIDDARLPAGVLNVLTAGSEVSAHMVNSPLVDKVSFTGSLEVGQSILRASAARLTRVTLELGGKSAAIVLDDVDFDRTVPELLHGSLNGSGQACRALTRFLVPEARHAEFMDALLTHVAQVVVGDPFDEQTLVGPLVSARQRARVESYIDVARAEGARLVYGGGRPTHLHHGWFVEPTVFDDVTPKMRIAQEEVFGPVISVLTYRDDADAVAVANDSIYGLSGAVFTNDTERGEAIARRVRAGSFNVGRIGISMQQPFGGYRCSGLGREGGPEGFDAYLETKQLFVPFR